MPMIYHSNNACALLYRPKCTISIDWRWLLPIFILSMSVATASESIDSRSSIRRRDGENNGLVQLPSADFFALITDTVNGQGSFRCGGSLIHSDIVLTASFCATRGDILRIGYHNDTYAKAIRTAEFVFNHPNAGGNSENFPNDLAVIKLDAPVDNVIPLELNSDNFNPLTNFQDSWVAHAGAVPDVWPRNFTIGSVPLARTFSTELRIVSQLTFPFRSCLNRYRSHRMPIYRSDPDRSVQFCATTSPVDGPCDSAAWGSPMWNFGRNGLSTIPIQIGIASQGSCTIGNPPYLYTQINRYVSWIHGQICQLSEEPPEFCNEEDE